MDELALLLWVVTIGGGSLLGALWLRHGGAKQAPDAQRPPSTGPGATTTMARPRSKIALSLIVPHASLGIVGAISWMLYRSNPDDTSYEPIRWLADRREAGRGAEAGDGPPERHLPLLVVVLHGLGAAATLVFVVPALMA